MHWIWRSIIINSLVGTGVIAFVFYSETGQTPDLKAHAFPLVAAVALLTGAGTCLHFFSLFFNSKMPWNKNITGRFVLEVTTGLLLVLLAGLIFSVLFSSQLVIPESDIGFWDEYWEGAVKFGIIALVVLYIYSLVNFSIFSYNLYSVHQIAKVRSERHQLNLQFEALKNQLSPHFLFNALNTISSLIYKDIGLAEDFIRRLADTYRYILQTNKHPLIKVREEIRMLDAFFYMQRIKYEDCIRLNVRLEEQQLDTYIPPLTLQMLLENALKHNLISTDIPLELTVAPGEGQAIEVKNNIIPKSQLLKIGNNLLDRPRQVKSHKIGLTNIRDRYAFFTGRKIELTKNEYFTVKLPLIQTSRDQNTLL